MAELGTESKLAHPQQNESQTHSFITMEITSPSHRLLETATFIHLLIFIGVCFLITDCSTVEGRLLHVPPLT